MTAEELMKMLKDKSIEVTVIDVRNPWELEQEGKIAGSINIPREYLSRCFLMYILGIRWEVFGIFLKLIVPITNEYGTHCS